MKLDKEQMAMRASHKAMNDPGLDFMMKKLDEAQIAKNSQLGVATDLDYAIPDDTRIKPKVYSQLMMFLMGGLFLGFIFSYFREFD